MRPGLCTSAEICVAAASSRGGSAGGKIRTGVMNDG